MNRLPRNIFITGFMGVGKTTVGKKLAERLQWHFVDTDQLIVERSGKSLETLFVEFGEPTLREEETTVLHKVCLQSRQVISLGGGTLIRENNQELVREAGTLIYLRANLETLSKRLATEKSGRPSLIPFDGVELEKQIQSLFNIRKTGYEMAHHWIETDKSTLNDILENTLKVLE